MYAKSSPRTLTNTRRAFSLLTLGLTGFLIGGGNRALAQSQVIRNITQSTERLEMTVNTSRILTLEKRIPRMVVNNPELVTVTALSANQIQLAARKPGVTQINLWDEDDQVFTVDVLIYGDVRELELALRRMFPESSVRVMRLTNSLVLDGFVERPEAVGPIIRLAEDYAPKVINNITVGGVQQILLKTKVMEVSRTKLRRMGFDFAQISGSNFVASSVSGILQSVSGASAVATGQTFEFGVVDGGDSFFGFLDALQQNNLAKVLADPTIVAVSGRPAHFNVGGELPILVPSGLGTVSVEYKEFGTQIDFLPIVLGNGNVRLEIRPRVSEIDETRSVTLNEFTVPALKVREVDTAVELKVGQTLAIAGLIQTRVDAQVRGLPFLSDLPYVGAAFRSVREEVNEIELLILVTPEYVAGMEPHEVTPCGPGMETVSPSNGQLYFGSHLEVPASGLCSPNFGAACGPGGAPIEIQLGASATATDEVFTPTPMRDPSNGAVFQGKPEDINTGAMQINQLPPTLVSPSPPSQLPTAPLPVFPGANARPAGEPFADPSATRGSPTRPRYPMAAQHNRNDPQYRPSQQHSTPTTTTPGLIGPIGYDVEK